MYELGRVYIWQNQFGEMAHLNDTETTVLTRPLAVNTDGGRRIVAQVTDSPAPPGMYTMAEPGDLRPKNPPSGERKINDMFRLTEFNN